MGSDDEYCVFRLASPVGFLRPVSVELDKKYKEGCPELQKTSPFDYRFRVPIKTTQKYPELVLRTGKGEPYLFTISSEVKTKPKTTIDTTGKPPQIKKGGIGPVEWSGTELQDIIAVTLITGTVPESKSAPPPTSTDSGRSRADFTHYDDGKKIEVYFKAEKTKTPGKASVEFLIKGGETKLAPLFITNEEA